MFAKLVPKTRHHVTPPPQPHLAAGTTRSSSFPSPPQAGTLTHCHPPTRPCAGHRPHPAGRPGGAGLGSGALRGWGPGRRLAPPRCKQESRRMKIARGQEAALSCCELPAAAHRPCPRLQGLGGPPGEPAPLNTPRVRAVPGDRTVLCCPRVGAHRHVPALTVTQHHVPQVLQGVGEPGHICQQLGDVLRVDEGTLPALHGAVGRRGLVALGHGAGCGSEREAGGTGMAAEAGGALEGAHSAGAGAELGAGGGQLPQAAARCLQAVLAAQLLGTGLSVTARPLPQLCRASVSPSCLAAVWG